VRAVERLTAVMGPVAAVVGPLAASSIAFVLARQTLQPGLAFWDTAEFQAVPPVLGTLHPTGFPAYVLLGWLASLVLAPLGEPAFRMNLFGALSVAGAVGLTAVLVTQLTGRSLLAVAVAVVLFLAPVTWRIASTADAHSLHLLLLALLLVVLVGWARRAIGPGGPGPSSDRLLVAAAAVYAVGLGNHRLMLLAAPGIALFVLAIDPEIRRRPAVLARSVAVFMALLMLQYLELPLRAGPLRAALVYSRPETWDGFWYVVLGQQFLGSLVNPFADLGRTGRSLVDLSVDQLGALAALVPIGFVVAAVRRWPYVLLTGPTLLLTCLFALTYANAGIERYYLGPLLIAVTWIAILVDAVLTAISAGLRVPLLAATRRGIDDGIQGPTGIRAAGPVAALVAGLGLELVAAAAIALPAVQAADRTRQTVDLSQSVEARAWVDDVLARLEPGAVVISWWSFSTPLWYARDVEGRRQDVAIVDDRTRLDYELGDVPDVIDRYLGRRPVYIIRPPDQVPELARRYDLQPIPDLAGSGLAQVLDRRTGDGR
jgi:Protein O-mannosyl-transferase TMEM260-like